MPLRRLFVFTLLGALLATPALAHPHIFIDAKATVVFDDSGAVTEVRNEWSFDEAFSAWSIEGLDVNNDGVVSREEQQELANQDMDGLAEYQFYTFAGEQGDDTNLKFQRGANPTRDFVDGHTILRFGVKFEEPYRIKKALELAINDPEYYVAITFAGPQTITLENAPAGCAVALEPGHDMPPELQEQLFQLPPDVTELPEDLATAIRGVQGAILVKCPSTGAVTEEPATALEAVTQVAVAKPAMPFGGPPPEPGIVMPRTGFLGWVNAQQIAFYKAMNEALSALKTDWNAFWVLGGLSFLYGVFHAAGPGHGKVVISSYVLANERTLKRGVVLSFAAAMVQSLVAVGFVLVAAVALNMTSLAMGDAANWIGIVSYGMVALLGLWLMARKLFGWGHNHSHTPKPDMAATARAHLHGRPVKAHALSLGRESLLDTGTGVRFPAGPDAFGRAPGDRHYGHDHGPDGHDHDHHHIVTPDQIRGDWREQLGVVLAVGARPCSGALVVLVFALSQGLLLAGIIAVLLMGLGTAITVAVLASLAVGAKGLTQRLLGAKSGVASGLIWWAELLGAMLVFSFGVILLLASL
jgi:nickel/cobalt exporter